MKRIFFSFFFFIMINIVGVQFVGPWIIEKPVNKCLEKEVAGFWREMVRGGFHVLLKDLKVLPSEEWDRYIRSLQPHFGYPLSLEDIDRLPLSLAEHGQLMDNRIVVKDDNSLFYQRIPGSQKAFIWGPVSERDEKSVAYWQELTRGAFYLLLEDLKALPPEQWDGYIQGLQPYFGYPLSLDNLDRLSLSPAERSQLMGDFIMVRGQGDLFRRRIPGSQKVMTWGPMPAFEAILWMKILTWSLVTLTFGFSALIWAWPFWLRLKKIIMAAQAFGRGEFDARADLPRRSALAQLAGTFNDMAERIQQLIRSHTELTRAVSHELRTPITRIRFSLEMAEEAGSEPDRRYFLSEIRQDVNELAALVSELLIYARFDREAPGLDLEEKHLAPWLRETVQATLPNSAPIACTCRIAPDAEKIKAPIAPRYMARAITNLLINASKYARSQVVVSLEKEDKNGLIHVDDDGPGIPDEDRERIFEPFVRIDSSRDRDTGGHGLGLAIVKRVVDLHRGRVWASRSPLGGARFSLCWTPHGHDPGICHGKKNEGLKEGDDEKQ